MPPIPLAARAARAALRAGVRGIGWSAAASLVLGVVDADPTWLWLDRAIARSPLHAPLLLLLVAATLTPLHRLPERLRKRAAIAIRAVLLVVAALALHTAIRCWIAWATNLRAMFPVPLSALIAAVLAAYAVLPWAPRPDETSPHLPASSSRFRRGVRAFRAHASSALGTGFAILLLEGAQILAVAYTDHRRDADAIVVLGARVYDSGQPSEALAQRVTTACELYGEGYAPKLILSGARDPGAVVSEPEAMRDLALECGVPADAIILDEEGVDTHSTAVDTARLLGPGARVLAVSHGYHLARIAIALDRQGIVAFTVPARERRLLPGKPWYVAREMVAWAVYLARG